MISGPVGRSKNLGLIPGTMDDPHDFEDLVSSPIKDNVASESASTQTGHQIIPRRADSGPIAKPVEHAGQLFDELFRCREIVARDILCNRVKVSLRFDRD